LIVGAGIIDAVCVLKELEFIEGYYRRLSQAIPGMACDQLY